MAAVDARAGRFSHKIKPHLEHTIVALSQSQPHRMTTPGLDSYFDNFSMMNLRWEDAYYGWSQNVRHPEHEMEHMPTAI
eukprot:11956117-Karenia_brevis.AAC.1